MKHLLLFLLSFIAGNSSLFAQSAPSTTGKWDTTGFHIGRVYTPDTVRCLLQVSSNSPMRVVYAIPGFVVLTPFVKQSVYLNDRRKALDPRFTVWQYLVIDEAKRKRVKQ